MQTWKKYYFVVLYQLEGGGEWNKITFQTVSSTTSKKKLPGKGSSEEKKNTSTATVLFIWPCKYPVKQSMSV